jgi:hypothetical protein
MLINEALDMTLRDVLRFAEPGRESREPVEVETLVKGLRALELMLAKQQAKFEANSRAWLAEQFEAIGGTAAKPERVITKNRAAAKPARRKLSR